MIGGIKMEAKRTAYVNKVKEAFRYNLHRINYMMVHNAILQVYGPPRCGKTSLVLKAVSKRSHVSYISFRNLTEKEAQKLFAKEALRHTGIEAALEWNAIFEYYKKLPTLLHKVLILDDINQTEGYEIKDAFLDFINDESYEKIFVVTIGEKHIFYIDYKNVGGAVEYLNYLSLFDTRQLVPEMDNYNALLVYTATGGIPELAKFFSGYPNFEAAIRDVLRYDSGYYLLMKRLIEQAFSEAGTV
jgi:hypothetical protein